jgi:mono/diheme cytochrome c family protein
LAGGVITYMRGGTQYVAVASGNVSRLTFGEAGSPTVIVYALGGQGGRVASAAPAIKISGAELYARVCAACHGGQGEGATGPALKGLASRMDLAKTIAWIEQPSAKMPKLYPSPLDADAVKRVAGFVHGL